MQYLLHALSRDCCFSTWFTYHEYYKEKETRRSTKTVQEMSAQAGFRCLWMKLKGVFRRSSKYNNNLYMLVCTAKEFLNKMSRAHVCVWVPTILTQEHTFKVIGKLVYKPVFNVCWFHGRAQIACGGSADGKITVEGKSWRMLVVNFQKPVFNLLGFYFQSYQPLRCVVLGLHALCSLFYRNTILFCLTHYYPA